MDNSNRRDTRKLLRECDAGIKMGISSLDSMISKADDPKLEKLIKSSRQEHMALRAEAEKQLGRINDRGKSPNPIAKAMSDAKTALTMQTGSDKDAARLISDGCEKGIISLNKYLDRYDEADAQSRHLTNKVIKAEDKLISDLEKYK